VTPRRSDERIRAILALLTSAQDIDNFRPGLAIETNLAESGMNRLARGMNRRKLDNGLTYCTFGDKQA
jgi:hypothetical protein